MLDFAARNVHMETLEFDGSNWMASADVRIGEFTQKRHFHFRPRFPILVPGWNSKFVTAGSHRNQTTVKLTCQYLIRYRAQQIQFSCHNVD
jgi:hypothetical protein